MKFAIRVLLLCAIVASFIHLSTEDEMDQRLNRVRRADDDDDEPTQEQIDAVRANLDRRAKVARPAYSSGPDEKKNKTKLQNNQQQQRTVTNVRSGRQVTIAEAREDNSMRNSANSFESQRLGKK